MGLRALIVDDSPVTRRVIRRMLDMLDLPIARISEAGDGLEALVCAREGADLLITDLHMPNLDGEGLLDRLADEGLLRDLQVVVCTSDRSLARHAAVRARGAHAVIIKPITPETLGASLAPLALRSA